MDIPTYDANQENGRPKGRDLLGLVLIGLFACCIVLAIVVKGFLFEIVSATLFVSGVLLLSGLGRKE